MHKLLTQQVACLGRPDVPPETDAVDRSVSEGTPASLKADLIDSLPQTESRIPQTRECNRNRC